MGLLLLTVRETLSDLSSYKLANGLLSSSFVSSSFCKCSPDFLAKKNIGEEEAKFGERADLSGSNP